MGASFSVNRVKFNSIAFVVLFLSLAGSFAGWRLAQRVAQQKTWFYFESLAKDSSARIHQRLELYIDALYGAQGLFAASDHVSRAEWAAYVSKLDIINRYPGLTALRFVEKVGHAEKEAFVREMRTDSSFSPLGYPYFSITPEGQRKEYYVVKYIEPFVGNEKMFGFDIGWLPGRMAVLEKARDLGGAVATSSVQVLAAKESKPGFVICLPVYQSIFTSTIEERKKSHVGFVDAVFRFDDLLANVLYEGRDLDRVDFELYDGTVFTKENLLYDADAVMRANRSAHPLKFATIIPIKFAQKNWMLYVTALPGFKQESYVALLPPLTLAAGLVCSLLLFAVLYSISDSRVKAILYADSVTQDLRAEIKERRLAEEKVNEAFYVKSDFISTVSHELRTPLAVIKETVNIVHDETVGPVNADQKDLLETAKRNIDRLARLIDNVLDYQKLESMQMQLKTASCDVNEVVEEVAAGFELLTSQKGLNLVMLLDKSSPQLMIDRDRIVQVLTNLLNNAVKFTEKGSIELGTRKEFNSVTVTVKDSGYGIQDGDIAKLFQSFSQLSSSAPRKTGGTGLGLAISKKIVELHGGSIGVESKPGVGSSFFFTLPVNLSARSSSG